LNLVRFGAERFPGSTDGRRSYIPIRDSLSLRGFDTVRRWQTADGRMNEASIVDISSPFVLETQSASLLE
jgi:hypothetical protein